MRCEEEERVIAMAMASGDDDADGGEDEQMHSGVL